MSSGVEIGAQALLLERELTFDEFEEEGDDERTITEGTSYVPPSSPPVSSSSFGLSSLLSKERDIADDGRTCLIDLLDTAGQEEYSAMRDQVCVFPSPLLCFLFSLSQSIFKKKVLSCFTRVRHLLFNHKSNFI